MQWRAKGSLIRFHFPHRHEAQRNHHLLSFSVLTKKEYPKLLEKMIKSISSFSNYIYVWPDLFFMSFNNKMFGNKLNEEDITWLPSIKSDVKETYKKCKIVSFDEFVNKSLKIFHF